jgi:hypothetical protein
MLRQQSMHAPTLGSLSWHAPTRWRVKRWIVQSNVQRVR